MANKRNDGLVFSTEHGRMCPNCSNPIDRCNCPQKTHEYQGDGIVRISRETKHRKGKSVTIITGIPLPPADLKKLARQLKNTCGAGGALKDGVIEIQGDHRQKILEELNKQKYNVKLAGG
jgi:translation initiation factor 1